MGFLGGLKMSLESWKKEFYPLINKDAPVVELIKHSLNKWKGALLKIVKTWCEL